MLLLFTVMVVALAFEFINGFHDTANSVAAVVGTKVLSPSRAIALAAVTNLCGALAGTAVASTIGRGLVEAQFVTSTTLICGLSGATIWNLITWRFGLPSSSSHALVGGLVGAVVATTGGWDAVIWSEPVEGKPWFQWGGLLYKVIIPMLSSPLLGLLVAFVWMSFLYNALAPFRAGPVNGFFRKLQILSAAFMGFSHGSNDAQKTMGIIALALFSATTAGTLDHAPQYLSFLYTPEFRIALWVKIVCAITMAAGTATGGRRIIKTLGRKVARLHPVSGFAADTTSGAVLLTAASLGMPVSTTHVVSTSIMGVAAAKTAKNLRLQVVERIVWAWVFTLPASGLAGYLISRFIRLF